MARRTPGATDAVLVPTGDGNTAVLACRARLRDRLVARLAPGAFDRRLAWGDAPDAAPATMLRARALIGRPARQALAARLREIAEEARGGVRAARACIPANRGSALRAVAELDALADRLAGGGPVEARGVAQAQLLLTDPASPLYERGAGEALQALAIQALAALEPS
jgi:hypothetical protein